MTPHPVSQPYLAQIAVRSVGRIQLIAATAIEWLVAAGNYVEVRVGSQSLLHRQPLQALAERLDPARFARIHRSVIVRAESVREVRCVGHGYHVVVCGDRTFRVGRKYRDALARLICAGNSMQLGATFRMP